METPLASFRDCGVLGSGPLGEGPLGEGPLGEGPLGESTLDEGELVSGGGCEPIQQDQHPPISLSVDPWLFKFPSVSHNNAFLGIAIVRSLFGPSSFPALEDNACPQPRFLSPTKIGRQCLSPRLPMFVQDNACPYVSRPYVSVGASKCARLAFTSCLDSLRQFPFAINTRFDF